MKTARTTHTTMSNLPSHVATRQNISRARTQRSYGSVTAEP